tara:strand:- start:21 stop:275 length:255 start_codon:yes stop_codon:yes gene_type:complete
MKCNLCNSTKFKIAIKIHIRDRFEIACRISGKDYARNWYQCKNCLALLNVHKKSNFKNDQNFFVLDENPIGKHNLNQLKFYGFL